jgi:glutathione synthase/RimK-type ligase-like ATP-grasp enzyme
LTRVALAGCSAIDDPDEPALVAALERRGVDALGVPWDADHDWTAYDLVVVRSTWDYVDRLDEFLAWADTVPRLANPASVLRWNTDKTYLGRLAVAGVPVVPTTYADASWTPPPGEYVVKPTVSAAARDTVRYRGGDEDAARAHVRRLLDAGRGVMVQPYVDAVEDAGETSVLFAGGGYSHGARKGPVLAGSAALSPVDTQIDPREPTEAERAVAGRVLAAVGGPLLYARVDLLPGPDGPMLLELELTEPFLFLATSDGAADRLAAAILNWVVNRT